MHSIIAPPLMNTKCCAIGFPKRPCDNNHHKFEWEVGTAQLEDATM